MNHGLYFLFLADRSGASPVGSSAAGARLLEGSCCALVLPTGISS